MDHPTIERIERTGHAEPVKIRRLIDKQPVYRQDPIEAYEEMKRKWAKQKA